jgi:UDP-2-acetamido-2-deoxy-ribo-hexuluronate aminotransferase
MRDILKIANLYKNNLNSRFVNFQYIPHDRKSAYCHFVIKVKGNKDGIIEKLKEKDIMASVHYPKPLHLQKAYSYLGYKKGDFPIAEKVCNELISLPMHPFLKNKEVIEICSKLNEILEKEERK